MARVMICSNPHNDTEHDMAKTICEMLGTDGHECKVVSLFDNRAEMERPGELFGSVKRPDLIISLGGDGTFLHVARATLGTGVPVLGVNMGGLGFLTDVELHELDLIRAAARGAYTASRRMVLNVAVLREDGSVYSEVALNEAVIKSDVNLISLGIESDGRSICNFSGDGVIVATPTGSTAYSMSAGGPIVEPEAENILVTPICAHGLAIRSFVMSPERVLTVRLDRLRGRRAMISVDGAEPVELSSGDVINVRRSALEFTVADMGHRSFFDMARDKLVR